MKLTPFVLQVLCSHVFSPSNRENMLVPLAGSGPLMNDWTSSLWSVSKSSLKSCFSISDCLFRISFFPTWMMTRFAVLCFITMLRSSLFTSETVAWGKQQVVAVLLLTFLIIESPTIRVLGSAALWAECHSLRHERQSEWHVKWLITVFFVYFKQMRSMSAPHSPPVPARKNEIRATGNLYHIL